MIKFLIFVLKRINNKVGKMFFTKYEYKFCAAVILYLNAA